MAQTDEKILEELRLTCAARAVTAESTVKAVQHLERTVYGNGKEGLILMVDRIEKFIEQVPDMVEEKVRQAIADLKPSLMDTDRVKLLVQEEIRKSQKEKDEEPGGWQEWRKTWLIPVVMIVVTSIIQGILAYVIVTHP